MGGEVAMPGAVAPIRLGALSRTRARLLRGLRRSGPCRRLLRAAAAELTKTKGAVVNLTLIVLGVSIAVGIYIAILDTAFHALIDPVL